MSLLRWLRIDRFRKRLETRNVDQYEFLWQLPGGRGWRQVDDQDRKFDPSNFDEPIPRSHFQTHAEARGYYQGEYRLVPIDEQGPMMESVWQLWFYNGPSLKGEKREQERKEARWNEVLQKAEKTLEELEECRNSK